MDYIEHMIQLPPSLDHSRARMRPDGHFSGGISSDVRVEQWLKANAHLGRSTWRLYVMPSGRIAQRYYFEFQEAADKFMDDFSHEFAMWRKTVPPADILAELDSDRPAL